jgi:hypothetical protein
MKIHDLPLLIVPCNGLAKIIVLWNFFQGENLRFSIGRHCALFPF